MQITVQHINERALEIYQKTLKDPGIPEDFSADIYELFIKRMKRYKEKNPEITELPDGIIAKAVQFIIRDLRKKEKLILNREESLMAIEQNLYGQTESLDTEGVVTPLLERLCSFIKTSTRARASYKDYTQFFLLYYSYYLPNAFIKNEFNTLGLATEALENLIQKLRSLAVERCSRQIKKADEEISKSFARIMANHFKAQQTTSRAERLAYYKDCRALHFIQKYALMNRNEIDIVPTVAQLSHITGIGEDKIYYGLNVFCESLKNRRFQNPGVCRIA